MNKCERVKIEEGKNVICEHAEGANMLAYGALLRGEVVESYVCDYHKQITETMDFPRPMGVELEEKPQN